MAVISGTDLFLFIEGIKVGKELGHSLSRSYRYIEKADRSNDRNVIMTDKEGSLNLSILVDYLATNSYDTLITAAEAQTLSSFKIGQDLTGGPEITFDGYITGLNQSSFYNEAVKVDLQIIISGSVTYVNPVFSSLWNTANTSTGSSASDSIQLPLISTGTYNFVVDWGDGTQDTITTWDQAETLHQYSGGGGTKQIQISGTVQGWQFNNSGDRNKIISISNWGSLIINSSAAYDGCNNLSLTSVSGSPTFNTTTLGQMFRSCTSLTTINGVENWDLSGVNDLDTIFNSASNFNEPNISSWDVSNVTNFRGVFQGCSVFNQDLSSWDVSSATSLASMFRNTNLYNNGGVALTWTMGTSLVNTSAMFENSDSFNVNIQNTGVNSWSVAMASVQDCSLMFAGCDVFNQDLSSWDVSSVTNMIGMFSTASGFNQDLGAWDLTSLTTAANMLDSSGMSQANYDATIDGWELPEAGTTPNGITLGALNINYTTGLASRTALINDHSWTFVGDIAN